MGKNKRIISIIVLVLALVTMIVPISRAEDPPSPPPHLQGLKFIGYSYYNITAGEVTSINFQLFDNNQEPYSGNVFAYLNGPMENGTTYTLSGKDGNYSISNVLFDLPGRYNLSITDMAQKYSAEGVITVNSARVITIGSLVLNDGNPSHQVIATLEDSSGKALAHKSLNIEGTLVGANNQTLTTDSNGQVKFAMTPTMLGNVNFYFGGNLVGTMTVQPAYTAGSRIGGTASNNASLSVMVAKKGWNSATNVILTRDDILVDSMTAVPLSKKLDAPILMTPSSALDSSVLQEIQRLHAKNVYIAGGVVAVTPAVEKALTDNGFNVIRVAGYDRYETAAKIAQLVGSNGTVYLANGYGEPDALAVSAFAAEQGNPILLTERGSLPDVTLAQLQALAPSNVNIIGGTAVVSNNIENQLKAQYVVQRWGGWDRYGTEQIVFQNLFTDQSPLYFASSLVEPSDVSGKNPNGDALLTAALAAKTNGFVVAVPPDNLPSPLATFLLYNKGYIPTATVVGNRTSITSNLEQNLQTLLRH